MKKRLTKSCRGVIIDIARPSFAARFSNCLFNYGRLPKNSRHLSEWRLSFLSVSVQRSSPIHRWIRKKSA